MPDDFSSFRNFFDMIVVDAPCSGEGMFRKDAFAVEQWSVDNVELCVNRQKEILTSIWGSLRPGGLLVYSTCTFNREENEDCVAWIAEELGATPLSLNIDDAWGVTGALAGDNPAYRFIPGYTSGEGFFLALLRKDGDAPLMQPRMPRVQQPVAKVRGEVCGWLKSSGDFDIVQQGDKVVALPKEHSAAMLALQQKLRVLHYGIELAEIKNNKLLPMHALAMSTAIESSAFHIVELELDKALAYLHRESLSLPDAPLGVLLLAYKGALLGFAKNIGNRANNLYPAEWRIRKNPMDL
jgi:NOL1/NOP2/fmu family ribosome biogenesis protein